MNEQNLIKVWDLPLRVFHWLLVAGFFIAYITEEELLSIHVWAGYLVFGLLVFRLVWGVVGNQFARFSNFLYNPIQAIRYVQAMLASKAKRYIGHNPAGAIMIVMLLSSLFITTITGFAVYGADQGMGPLASIGSADEKLWELAHEFSADFTLALVVLHVVGVVLESWLHKENLVKSMWNGWKKPLEK